MCHGRQNTAGVYMERLLNCVQPHSKWALSWYVMQHTAFFSVLVDAMSSPLGVLMTRNSQHTPFRQAGRQTFGCTKEI